jgi:hypothetical protein
VVEKGRQRDGAHERDRGFAFIPSWAARQPYAHKHTAYLEEASVEKLQQLHILDVIRD